MIAGEGDCGDPGRRCLGDGEHDIGATVGALPDVGIDACVLAAEIDVVVEDATGGVGGERAADRLAGFQPCCVLERFRRDRRIAGDDDAREDRVLDDGNDQPRAGALDADIGERAGREQAAQRVVEPAVVGLGAGRNGELVPDRLGGEPGVAADFDAVDRLRRQCAPTPRAAGRRRTR